MRKIIYIIPGFTETVNRKGYQEAIKSFEAQNFQVVPIKISWTNKVMSDYVEEFLGQLTHKKNDEVSILGFSFGAMIAFICAKKIKPKNLFLCSLSPFFKEDLKLLKPYWKIIIGKKRFQDFENFSFKKLVKDIHSNTFLFVGEREPQQLLNLTNLAHKNIKGSKIFVIKNVFHNISQKKYFEKLQTVITNLKL